MAENACATCKYYKKCDYPERFMRCMGYERGLQVGDTIQCANAEDAGNMTEELARCDIETDFLYEKDGVKGLWLEVLKVGGNNA